MQSFRAWSRISLGATCSSLLMGLLVGLLVCNVCLVSATVHIDSASSAATSSLPLWRWEVRVTNAEPRTYSVHNVTDNASEAERAHIAEQYGSIASSGTLQIGMTVHGWDVMAAKLEDTFYLSGAACVNDSELDVAYYALGLGEGVVTQDALFYHLHNMLNSSAGLAALFAEFHDELVDWFTRQEHFLYDHLAPKRRQRAVEAAEDAAHERAAEYADQVFRQGAQLRGVVDGYNAHARQRRQARSFRADSETVTSARIPTIRTTTRHAEASPQSSAMPRRHHDQVNDTFQLVVPSTLEEDSLTTFTLQLLNQQREIGDIVRAILYTKAREREEAMCELRGVAASCKTNGLSAAGEEALAAQFDELAARYPEVMLDDRGSALVTTLRQGPNTDDLTQSRRSTAAHEIVMAHSTWNAYHSMARLHKSYTLQLYTANGLPHCTSRRDTARNTPRTDTHTMPHRLVSMSSYPGLLHSLDHYYTSQARLVIMETSYSLVDPSAYAFVTPESVPGFVRVMVANYLAGDVPAMPNHSTPYTPGTASASTRPALDWLHWFGRYNGGAGNGAWLVLVNSTQQGQEQGQRSPTPAGTHAHTRTVQESTDLFLVGETVPAGALHAYRQSRTGSPHSTAQDERRGVPRLGMPAGLIVFDMTHALRDGISWASYNIPAFNATFHITGTARRQALCGSMFDYDEAPRARAFRDGLIQAHTADDVVRLMRWGPFRTDVNADIPNCTGAGVRVRAVAVQHDTTTTTTLADRCDPPYSSFLTIAARGDLNPRGGQERYGPCHVQLSQRNRAAIDVKWSRVRWGPVTAVGSAAAQVPRACAHSMQLQAGPPHADEWLPPSTPRAVARAWRREYAPFDWACTALDPVPGHRGLPQGPYRFPSLTVAVPCNGHDVLSPPPPDTRVDRISVLGWLALSVLVITVLCVVGYVLKRRAAVANNFVMTEEEIHLLRGQ